MSEAKRSVTAGLFSYSQLESKDETEEVKEGVDYLEKSPLACLYDLYSRLCVYLCSGWRNVTGFSVT